MDFPVMEQFLSQESLLLSLLSGLLSSIPSFIFSIAAYVLSALGLYTMASRRGLHHPWLAWVPVANLWITGSLADQFRYVARGEIRSKRKTLVILEILSVLLGAVTLVMGLGVAGRMVSLGLSGRMSEAVVLEAFSSLFGVLALLVPAAGLGIARKVIRFMALYDIYGSCDPDNKLLFILLSIFIPFTEPFFLFFCRNKDGGMPPRKTAGAPVETFNAIVE